MSITPPSIAPATEHAIRQFLGYEALLLDQNRLADWAALLDPAIIYEIPMRIVAKGGADDEFPPGSFRVRDDLAMIQKRIERHGTAENWAEDPPSRTVRNVSSIFIEPTDDAKVFRVHSALTLYRQRALDRAYEWIPARRSDLIRVESDGCRLVRRTIILAETILQTPNLGIFL
ncbi:aromatic-ring-hydroxylating dioxygenase subunit beta [Sphingosinicella sp.]|uniref:aromatic-ring-hydroxylating dioxygenase subunit beta n=1 Tax=Sphingosinicella sp. TaxID=1917971 RepID=UPI001814AF55|nr:aromatic-ring-hydroxylating dioxygenase subunit beta [Sphingosinicella sp.]MBA4759007.1 phenylpropionate dioxygenase [Sphingosinicella sp.]